MKHFMNSQCEYANESMMSLPHNNCPIIFFTKITKIPYFSYEKVKLALYPHYIKANIMFALIYFDMGTYFYMFEQKIRNLKMLCTKYVENSEAMTSSTPHLHIHSDC